MKEEQYRTVRKNISLPPGLADGWRKKMSKVKKISAEIYTWECDLCAAKGKKTVYKSQFINQLEQWRVSHLYSHEEKGEED